MAGVPGAAAPFLSAFLTPFKLVLLVSVWLHCESEAYDTAQLLVQLLGRVQVRGRGSFAARQTALDN
jgi:hypothetical protein